MTSVSLSLRSGLPLDPQSLSLAKDSFSIGYCSFSGVSYVDMPFCNSKKDLMTVLESPGCQVSSKTCFQKNKFGIHGNDGQLEMMQLLHLS